MNLRKLVAVLFLAAGVFVLVYGSVSFGRTKETAKVGPFELSVAKKERVEVPKWAGVAAIAVGAALLLVPSKR